MHYFSLVKFFFTYILWNSRVAFLLIGILFWCDIAIAQYQSNYVSHPILDTIPAAYHSSLLKKLSEEQANIESDEKDIKKTKQALLEKRTNFVIQSFNDDYFIVDSKLTLYLQDLLKAIYKFNPNLPNEVNVFVYRSRQVNALSFGDGMIALTLGLLSRLKNESQILFVLCHELAHYHADHTGDKIDKLANLFNDKELKKKIKSIKKDGYEQNTKLSQLFSSLELSVSRHSRENESEADSIGYVYYLNTNADPYSPLKLLDILDSADVNLHSGNLNFKEYFDFKEYPFKDHWLEYSPTERWYASDFKMEDTIFHTHPNCLSRKIAIERQLKKYHPEGVNKVISTYTEIKNTFSEECAFEMIESDYHFNDYGNALFHSLILLEKYPANAYLISMVGKCLYELYIRRENHEFGKIVPQVDARFPENYNRFLSFMHTLRSNELASLSYYFIATQKSRYIDFEEFAYTYWLVSQIGVGNENVQEIKNDYKLKFPQGKYIENLNKLF
jgi:hypothetical protein